VRKLARSRRFLRGYLVFVVVIVVGICILNYRPEPTYQRYSGPLPTGTLLFTTGKSSSVYRLDLPSRQVERVLQPKSETSENEWIAYVSGPNKGVFAIEIAKGNCFVFRKSSGGKECRLISNLGPVCYPTVSPDGTRVAYYDLRKAVSGSDPTELRIVDLRTKAVTTVSKFACPFSHPSWSADGTRIAYSEAIDKAATLAFPHENVSEDYLKTSARIECVGTMDLRTRRFIPVGIGSGAIWGPSEKSLFGDWWSGPCTPFPLVKGESTNDKSLPDLEKICGVMGENLLIYSTVATEQDRRAATYGRNPSDDVVSVPLIAIRLGSPDGLIAKPLVCVYGENPARDAESGFAASWSFDRW
jgi:WD40-like Beta Propeller Repeat